MYRTMKLHFNLLVITILLLSVFVKVKAQQKKEITGYVYSVDENIPIDGIKVSTKFRKVKSATTNVKGLFTLEIPDDTNIQDYMLTFSYPGYEMKEQYGSVDDTMMVYLVKTGDYSVDEKVYYPYNSKKGSNLTSAAEKVNFEYSTQVMSISFEQLLENSTVQVTSASGAPGEGRTLNIRGYSTIFADERPLIVVDGQVLGNYHFDETTFTGFYQDPLINIDPRNIEAITILKDAAATAIYGAKASNGVILIKTKSAKVGKTEFDITGFFGTNFMNKRLPVIQSSDYFKPYLLEQMYGNGLVIYDEYFIEDPSFSEYYKYNNSTDWQDFIFEPGKTAGANINVRGGDAIAKYFFAGGYIRDEGSVSNTSYNRFNIRFNADVDITDWLTAQANMGIAYSNGQMKEQGLTYANPILSSLIKAPFFDPYLKDSNNVTLPITEDADYLGISNPYEVINSSELNLSSYNFIGSLNFTFKINEDMEANLRGGSELNKMNEFVFLPNHGFYNNDYPNYNQVKKGISNFSRTSTEINFKYNKNYNEIHNLSAIAGMRLNFDEVIQDISSGVGTPSDEFKDLGTTLEEGRTKSGYKLYRHETSSFLGVSYNLKEEYFIDFAVSADASSSIGEKAKPRFLGVPMAFSPAIGIGWNMSDFLNFNYHTLLNYLKLRASIGRIANVVYNPYISKNYYAPTQYYTATGYAKLSFGNEDLTWEKTNKLDFGADLTMLKQRLFVSADVYIHKTLDVLNNSNTEPILGSQAWTNNGDLKTIGSELNLKFKAYNGQNFKWNTELSLGNFTTKVENLENDLVYDFGDGEKIFRNGEKAGSFYGYKVKKVIASEREATLLNLKHANGSKFSAGDIQFEDRDKNHIINDADKVIIGNSTPDIYGSWVNIFTYWQLKLLTEISFVYGNDLYNHTRRELESMDGFENQSKATLRRWQVDGQQTDIPSAAWGDPMGNSRFSDRWIEDGSYIRLKRITISLNLNKWLKLTNSSEFYITGINLFTIDKYLGYDPEFSYGGSILWEGIDYCKFPQNKSFMVGIKFGL